MYGKLRKRNNHTIIQKMTPISPLHYLVYSLNSAGSDKRQATWWKHHQTHLIFQLHNSNSSDAKIGAPVEQKCVHQILLFTIFAI